MLVTKTNHVRKVTTYKLQIFIHQKAQILLPMLLLPTDSTIATTYINPNLKLKIGIPRTHNARQRDTKTMSCPLLAKNPTSASEIY